jgi:hypothetical protein
MNTTIRGEQLAQSVFLIKALGGGWSASSAAAKTPDASRSAGNDPAS